MTDRWWKKKGEKDPWSDIFREFDRINKMMDEMMRRTFQPFKTPEKNSSFKPQVYGFSISAGPEGKPKIRRFGDLKKDQRKSQIKEERPLLVDVLEEGEEVVVVAEFPGVNKRDIDLKASEEKLTIHVDNLQRKYRRVLSLPAEVNPKKADTSYKNGVLQVKFKKKR